jgi:hypothetical protein
MMTFGSTTRGKYPKTSQKSLLFQFILLEFINSYTEVLNILKITNVLHISLKEVQALNTSLSKLAGSARGSIRFFSWNMEDGILSRLKNYCANYALEAKDSPGILKMQTQLTKVFINCRETLEAIRLAEENELSEPNKKILHKILNTIIRQMNRFSKLTTTLMKQFSADENVVFFILRHKAELNNLLGSQFILKLFKKMYPKGADGAKEFLIKNYGLRGFNHLEPQILQQISELKAS